MTTLEALVMLVAEYQRVFAVSRAKAKRLIRLDLTELDYLERRALEGVKRDG